MNNKFKILLVFILIMNELKILLIVSMMFIINWY